MRKRKYNIAVYNYLSDNDRFAELINASEFGGKTVLRGDMLESDDSRYAVLCPKQKQSSKGSQLDELWSREEYRHLDRDTAKMIAIITDSTTVLERLDEYEMEGDYDMCKAMDDMKEELVEKTVERNIKSLVQTLKLTAEQAMDALLVPEDERGRYMAKM